MRKISAAVLIGSLTMAAMCDEADEPSSDHENTNRALAALTLSSPSLPYSA